MPQGLLSIRSHGLLVFEVSLFLKVRVVHVLALCFSLFSSGGRIFFRLNSLTLVCIQLLDKVCTSEYIYEITTLNIILYWSIYISCYFILLHYSSEGNIVLFTTLHLFDSRNYQSLLILHAKHRSL